MFAMNRMATRFKKLRTRRMKRRNALRTRKQKGGLTLFGRKITFPTMKKNVPLKSNTVTNTSSNVIVSGTNPMAQSLNARKANLIMNKIQAELNKNKGRTTSVTSDPGSV